MKLNFDAVRLLMIVIEEQPRNIDINKVFNDDRLSNIDKNEIAYALEKLIESRLLIGRVVESKTSISFLINSISLNGHEFLDSIRKDSNWEKVKSKSKELGLSTITGIAQIASQLTYDYLKKNLNL